LAIKETIFVLKSQSWTKERLLIVQLLRQFEAPKASAVEVKRSSALQPSYSGWVVSATVWHRKTSVSSVA